MKKLVEYVNEAFNSKALYNYVSQVREFFNKYNVTVEQNKKKMDKFEQSTKSSGHASYPKLTKNVSFKAYPMAIIIDKFGYEEKLAKKYYWADETETDWGDYADFIVNKCKEEGKTVKDLAQWWFDYDNEIMKKNWEDPKWLLKQIDVTRFWNPYYPNDDSCLQAVIETPAKIFTYVKSDKTSYWNLSKDEREDVLKYYTDPTNAEALSKAIKSAKKKIEAERPSYSTAVQNWVKSITEDTKFEGGLFDKDFNLKKAYDDETNADQTMYRGTNTRNALASAMISLITKALDDKFNFKADPKELVDSGDGIKITIKDLGPSKKHSETGAVSSSSFWTYYNYDFDVTIYNGEEEIFNKKYENITVASSYYSGGW